VVPGTDGCTCATTTCWRCQSLGHFSDRCPTADNETGNSGDGHTQLGVCLHPQSLGIKSKWHLLDTEFTLSEVSNPSLVSDVNHCSQDDIIQVHSNSRLMDFTQQGHLRLFDFPVFNSKSLANIISLKDVMAQFCITMDSLVEKVILVHVNDDMVYKFMECGQGLYYLDTKHLDKLPKPNSTKKTS